jgi:hypothetical protein
MTSVVDIDHDCEGMFTANFVGNAASDSLVCVTASTTKFTSCAFVDDDSRAIIDGYALLTDCFFSDTIRQGMFPKSYRATDCRVNVGWETQDFEIAPSAVCWVLMPRRTTGTLRPIPGGGGSSAGTVLTVICLILVVVGAAYLALRWWHERHDANQPLTVYARV